MLVDETKVLGGFGGTFFFGFPNPPDLLDDGWMMMDDDG